MKKHCWLTLSMMIATVAVAQDNNTNSLTPVSPLAPSPTTEVAPAAQKTKAPKPKPVKHKRHAAPAEAALAEPSVSLPSGPAEVTVKNLNVRAQAGFKGVVIAHVAKGETVTVLGQINLDKHRAGEPAQWAKIALPSSAHVWVFSRFIDAATKTVVPKRLNLRAGPGENYGVLGTIEHGTAVNEITTKGRWMEIEPPANAYAFVAAMYLEPQAPAPSVANVSPTETAPAPTPMPVPETPPVVPEATNVPPPTEASTVPVPAIINTAPTTRMATHEGVVRHVGSLIAPTAYVLYDPKTQMEIDYLYSTSTNLDIARYNNMRIIATGEEGLAHRWANTPVMTVESIVVLETNAVPHHIYYSPRQSQNH